MERLADGSSPFTSECNQPLVPEALLSRSKRVLFFTHLAIGDFTYMQNCFVVFKKKYPHLKIDLWVDEVRRSYFGNQHLKKYALIDWISGSGLFDKIYFGSHTWNLFYRQIRQAKKVQYPLVVSLCPIRSVWYARCARKIAPRGFVGAVFEGKRSDIADVGVCAELSVCRKKQHISQIYQDWFKKFFDLSFSQEQQYPFVVVPREWISYGKLLFIKWGIAPRGQRFNKVVFINVFAKNAARCWPVDRLIKLINLLRKDERFEDAHFILNVEPRFYNNVKTFLSNYCLHRVLLFTAHENFFQLPAIISLCDLVISVETSVVHLASALQIPVVALMRNKNPEWTPYYRDNSQVVFAPKRKGWVEDIGCMQVVDEVKKFVSQIAL